MRRGGKGGRYDREKELARNTLKDHIEEKEQNYDYYAVEEKQEEEVKEKSGEENKAGYEQEQKYYAED